MKKQLKNLKIGATSLALALLVPGAAFAQTSTPLSDGMGSKVTEIIAEVGAGALLILGIVGAVVAAKVIFGLFKKA